MKRLICLAVIAMVLAIAGSAFASPIYCPITGHSYEVVAIGTTWTNAEYLAAKFYGIGVKSYLAVINSEAENTWIWNTLGRSKLNHYWLGGSQASEGGLTNPEGGWSWVNYDDWAYANWDTNEANNWAQKDERYLQFSEPNSSVGNVGGGKWNDALNNASSGGYVVESHITPEPTSAALLGMGIIGFVGMIRRKFKA